MTMRLCTTSLKKRTLLVACCAAAGGMLLPAQSSAQAYPTKPIRIVVAYATGGSIDLAARRIADDLAAELGQPVLVENKGGANGVPATEFVARADPDGHTILFTTLPAHAGNVSAYRNLPYDTITDFKPVTVLAIVPLVLVAHPSLPANNVGELIKLAKERAGKINYASFGVGGMAHLAGVQMNLQGKTQMNHVPYKGGGPAMADVVGNHVDLYFSGLVTALPLIKDGKLKALAVSSKERQKAVPNVPAVAETPGFEHFEAVVSPIMLVPARTPDAIVNRIQQATYKVVHTPQHRAKLEKAAEGEPRATTPEETMKMLKAEVARLAGLFKTAGIQPE